MFYDAIQLNPNQPGHTATTTHEFVTKDTLDKMYNNNNNNNSHILVMQVSVSMQFETATHTHSVN